MEPVAVLTAAITVSGAVYVVVQCGKKIYARWFESDNVLDNEDAAEDFVDSMKGEVN